MTNSIQNNINIKLTNYKDVSESGKEKKLIDEKIIDVISTNNKDSIEIKETDEEKINLKKAQNAWKESIDKFSPKERIDIITTMLTLKTDMEINGKIQGFALNADGKASYKDFINKILEYKDKPEISGMNIQPYFFDFCQQYKEALIKYDCK